MTDATANPLLEHKFERTLGAARHDLYDMREELLGVNRRLSTLEEGQALMNRRWDRLDERVSRIEKRLDLVEG